MSKLLFKRKTKSGLFIIINLIFSVSMKRCKRCGVEESVDPYFQTNFEATLRQYGQVPRKLVKTDRSCVFPLRENVCNVFDPVDQPSLNDRPQAEIAEQDVAEHLSSPQIDCQHQLPPLMNSHEELAEPHENSENQSLGEEIECVSFEKQPQKQKRVEQQLPQVDKLDAQVDQPEKPSKHFETGEKKEHEASPAKEQEEQLELEEQQGGRLYLNDRVSVSRRTLQKHLLRSSSPGDLLERLLQTRAYLRDESDSISRRLSDYLAVYGLEE